MCSSGRDISNGNCALQMRKIWALWSRRGVLYLKPYLTAWINSPLFCCWAGAHPLLVLSFNNHAGSLSPLQCTVSRTGITNPGSSVRVTAQWTIILPSMLAWLRCQRFTYVREHMSSPIKFPFQNNFLVHLVILWNAQIGIGTASILPGLSYIKKYFQNTFMEWRKILSMHTGRNVKRSSSGKLIRSSVFFGPGVIHSEGEISSLKKDILLIKYLLVLGLKALIWIRSLYCILYLLWQPKHHMASQEHPTQLNLNARQLSLGR